MSERTPNMNTIRHAWVKAHPFPLTTDVEERYAEFDRWLAAHDAEVRAEQGEPSDAQVEAAVQAFACRDGAHASREDMRAALCAALHQIDEIRCLHAYINVRSVGAGDVRIECRDCGNEVPATDGA